jgi:hypothetical protein
VLSWDQLFFQCAIRACSSEWWMTRDLLQKIEAEIIISYLGNVQKSEFLKKKKKKLFKI